MGKKFSAQDYMARAEESLRLAYNTEVPSKPSANDWFVQSMATALVALAKHATSTAPAPVTDSHSQQLRDDFDDLRTAYLAGLAEGRKKGHRK